MVLVVVVAVIRSAVVVNMAAFVSVFVFVFIMIVLVTLSVIVPVPTSMTVSVPPQHKKTDNVGQQPKGADAKDKLGIFDLRRLDESGYGLEDDGHAERDQKHRVKKGAQHLGPHPLLLLAAFKPLVLPNHSRRRCTCPSWP